MTQQETRRQEALRTYDILDTPPDGSYDHIVSMVAKLLDVPIAIISLVDADRIWFKSAFGLEAQQIPLEKGLCASAILSDEFYLIEDTLKDPRSQYNSLVTSGFGLRFYAAAPLTTTDGYNLGTLCILDKKTRTMTPAEQELLSGMAKLVIDQLELRLMARTAINAQNKMAYMVTHDIRSAVSNIPDLVDALKEHKQDAELFDQIGEMIVQAAHKSLHAADLFIKMAVTFSQSFSYRFERFDLSELISRTVSVCTVVAAKKQQTIAATLPPGLFMKGDRTKMTELVDNLLSNAIKYSTAGTAISLRAEQTGTSLVLQVQDQGQGMTADDQRNAFKRFGKLSATPTGNEASTGLGLWIVKEIAEKHGGHVQVYSEGKDRGTLFTVTLPAA